MKHRGFALWEVLAVLAVIIIAAVLLFPLFGRSPHPRRSICQSNLKQIALGFRMYGQDHDEKLPLVVVNESAGENSAYGWADALQPYLKSTQILQCDWDKTSRSLDRNAGPADRGYTDYWFNRNLAGRTEKSFKIVSATILAGGGNNGSDNTNARYSLSALPAGWRTNEKSPAHRHLEGANYAFADGHVKWYKPSGILDAANEDDAELGPSFIIR